MIAVYQLFLTHFPEISYHTFLNRTSLPVSCDVRVCSSYSRQALDGVLNLLDQQYPLVHFRLSNRQVMAWHYLAGPLERLLLFSCALQSYLYDLWIKVNKNGQN